MPTLWVFGQCNRAAEDPSFLDPMRTGHFTVAVQGKEAGTYWLKPAGAPPRHDHRDTRSDGPGANLQGAFSPDQRRVADLDAGDVGHRVASAGSA